VNHQTILAQLAISGEKIINRPLAQLSRNRKWFVRPEYLYRVQIMQPGGAAENGASRVAG